MTSPSILKIAVYASVFEKLTPDPAANFAYFTMIAKESKALLNFSRKILGSRGKAPWRSPQRAKSSIVQAHFFAKLFLKEKKSGSNIKSRLNSEVRIERLRFAPHAYIDF